MTDGTGIQWTDTTWNPVRGCSRVSEGCRNCYAEKVAAQFGGPGMPYDGLTTDGRWNGTVRVVKEHLDDPIRWRRPRRIFVNSMSDLFHEALSDAAVDRIFGVMIKAWWHTFQVLTKRPERMKAYLARIDGGRHVYAAAQEFPWPKWAMRAVDRGEDRSGWPIPNVWLGVSVEDQATADERIPLLLRTPAAVRFVSYEPALGPVDFANVELSGGRLINALNPSDALVPVGGPRLDWVIVGGESGPGARPCDVAWIRQVVGQCHAASVPVFVKQLGAFAMSDARDEALPHRRQPGVGTLSALRLELPDAKGGDPSEWPADLRVREFPQ